VCRLAIEPAAIEPAAEPVTPEPAAPQYNKTLATIVIVFISKTS